MHGMFAAGDEIGGYRIEFFIARGGMAVVYGARDVRLNRQVALKVLTPELAQNDTFRQRFIRESKLAASIDHPHIIPIYRAGQFGDVLYLAMRYVDGTDLGGLLAQKGLFPLDLAVRLFDQIAAALDSAHEHNLVHRDVKPGNVLVATDAGQPDHHHLYLTDFGLTKRTASLSGLTAPGHFLGTVDYVAPEQITGQPTDARTDVYGLGCVLYEALTGRRPFERDAEAAVIYAHLSEPPPSVAAFRPDLPPAVDRIVATAMAKEPDRRYPTCQGLVNDLRALGATAARVPASPPDPPAGRLTRRHVTEPALRPDWEPPSSRPTREHRTQLPPLRPAEAPTPSPGRQPASTPDPPVRTDYRDQWVSIGLKAALVLLAAVALYLMFAHLEA